MKSLSEQNLNLDTGFTLLFDSKTDARDRPVKEVKIVNSGGEELAEEDFFAVAKEASKE